MQTNILIKSDNITALNYLLENGLKRKIDLVYIDPHTPQAEILRLQTAEQPQSAIQKTAISHTPIH